jgi:hypothetical protein
MNPIQADVDYRELMIQLRILQNLVDRREIVDAERKAAKMLMERGKDRLIATLIGNSDYLVDSFTYKLRKGKFSGVLVGFKRPGGNVAHLVDLGTKDRYTKNGAYRGKIIGSRFWTDTKEQYVPKAIDDMMEAVDRAIRKINGRM